MAVQDTNGVLILDSLPPEGLIRVRQKGDQYDRVAVLADGTVVSGNGSAAPQSVVGTVELGYGESQIATNAPGVIVATLLNLPATSRPVAIDFTAHVSSTVTTDTGQIELLYNGATVLDTRYAYTVTTGGYTAVSGHKRIAPQASPFTLQLRVGRLAGTGTVTAQGNAVFPVVIHAYLV